MNYFENVVFDNGYIDFKKTKVDTIRVGLLFRIQWEYTYTLNEYLSINPVATEKDYIKLIKKNQIEEIESIEKEVDFFFNPDELQTEEVEILSNRNYYWKLKLYIAFLEKRLVFLDESISTQPKVESLFSALEWATIFYYADETNLLSDSRLKKTRMEQFMSKHQINKTNNNFKNKYSEAKRRINEKKDYPVNKLEKIIPFLKENYKQTVTKVENDIIFLKDNKLEY